MSETRDAVVIGGGFFGCSLALMLARGGARVTLLESGPALLTRASAINQARVHAGYHYPRSILTGLRSRVSAPRFLEEYASCVVRGFPHYYAIARRGLVSPRQFETFCRRIDAPLARAPAAVRGWFDRGLIAEVYAVDEPAFDVGKLRAALAERLASARVEVRLGALAESVSPAPGGLSLALDGGTLAARQVFNCTYARLNRLLVASGEAPLPLRHELAEIALVAPVPALDGAAVTVMCGPFFSIMPFPPRGACSLSHVRYTPHCAWSDGPGFEPLTPALDPPPRSRFPHMIKDAARYLPLLEGAEQLGSIFEVKTLLPQSALNDSRPILFHRSARLPGLVSVLGGKIDNVYDLPRELELLRSAA